ncbi:MAG: WbuC family cupin fold metalloprotein [Bacteroidales bacterium]|nr:WbuC family cupin fold metalloprotein [Bacteroidales bacterium]
MLLNENLFDRILVSAEASPRRRMHFDLRTSAEEPAWTDMSQRMLNVLTPGTEIPVHRHRDTSESIIVLRGAVCVVFYNDAGEETEAHELRYGGPCPGIQIPRGTWHNCRCLEPKSVIFEAKDRPYDPQLTEDYLHRP